jgi:hypothetical protein
MLKTRKGIFENSFTRVKKEAQFNCITQGSIFFLRQMAIKRLYGFAA